VDVVRERAPAEDIQLLRPHAIEHPVDEALVAGRPRPALGRRLLPVHAVRLRRASRRRGKGDRLVRRDVEVADPLRHRRAEGARGRVEELVAEHEIRLLDGEDDALDVIDVPGAQLVKIANVAVRGGATPAVAPRVRRPEPERLQDREAGILDALMVVRDREVPDVVHLPRRHKPPTRLDHGVRSCNTTFRSDELRARSRIVRPDPLRSAAPGPRSRR
jgi:hypothetical protein